jgi:hypothetical protein
VASAQLGADLRPAALRIGKAFRGELLASEELAPTDNGFESGHDLLAKLRMTAAADQA